HRHLVRRRPQSPRFLPTAARHAISAPVGSPGKHWAATGRPCIYDCCHGAIMKHLGILAHSTEGAALCFLEFCQEGVRRLGSHVYPDVTLDYIAFGHSLPAWD